MAAIAVVVVIWMGCAAWLLRWVFNSFFSSTANLPRLVDDPVTAAELESAVAHMRRRRLSDQATDGACPICLDAFSDAVEFLPCAHLACRDCASGLLQHAIRNDPAARVASVVGHVYRSMRCPVCRGLVDEIVPSFHRRREQAGAAGITDAAAVEALLITSLDHTLLQYNHPTHRMGNPSGGPVAWGRSLRVLLSEALYTAREFFSLPNAQRLQSYVALVGMVAYVLSPLDIIPDVIPIVGWLDDVIVIAAVLMIVIRAVVIMGGLRR